MLIRESPFKAYCYTNKIKSSFTNKSNYYGIRKITDFRLFFSVTDSDLGNGGIASSRLTVIGGVILFESKSTIQTSLGNLENRSQLFVIHNEINFKTDDSISIIYITSKPYLKSRFVVKKLDGTPTT